MKWLCMRVRTLISAPPLAVDDLLPAFPTFKAHRLLHHSTLGLRVIKQKKILHHLNLCNTAAPYGMPELG